MKREKQERVLLHMHDKGIEELVSTKAVSALGVPGCRWRKASEAIYRNILCARM